MNEDLIKVSWKIAFCSLLVCWVLGAGLDMIRFHGGFLTNYLADLTFPPFYYIFIRGKIYKKETIPDLLFVGNWFGISPERASISIFIVGVLMELKTLYWPHGPFAGTFDPMDILAYAVGLIACYIFDKWTTHFPESKNEIKKL
jgi:hypothetical protein